MGRMSGKDPIAPDRTFEIDLFRPEDAEGIGRLFRSVYGDGYPIKTYYMPEHLARENARGQTISLVARTGTGDIAGHAALYRSAPSRTLYEYGAALVLPDYRRCGINRLLLEYSYEKAPRRFRIDAFFCEAVCNHVFMQKTFANFGATETALEVDLMPAQAYTREKSAKGRVSSLLLFREIASPIHRVYLPGAYQTALGLAYGWLKREPRITPAGSALPAQAATETETQVFDFAQVARVTVQVIGSDFDRHLNGLEEGFATAGATVIQVWLPLSSAWVGGGVDILRDRGYFLGGLLPCWFGGDGLLMQKIINRPNWDGIELYTERGRKILEFVRADWERVAGRRP